MMRVGIDSHAAEQGPSGNRTYIECLLEGMSDAPPDEFVLYHLDRRPPTLRLDSNRFVWKRLRPRWVPARLSVGIAFAARRDKLDLLHFQYHSPLVPPGCPHVTTVHDITFDRISELYRPFDRWMISTMVKRSMSRARIIITLSEFSKRDIVDQYAISPARIVVTPAAARPGMGKRPEHAIARVRSKFRIAGDYLLYVGRIEPRKNLLRVIEAYASLAWADGGPSFIVAGPASFLSEPAMRRVHELGLQGCVNFLGPVDIEDLACLYSGAVAYVFPSLYEGFGLGVLEAMVCGTPVITSNTTSLPEIAGGAALLVDPTNQEEISDALRRITTDTGLRQELSRLGLRRANEFSWQLTAAATLDAYRLAR